MNQAEMIQSGAVNDNLRLNLIPLTTSSFQYLRKSLKHLK
jgi:hypothetical protein